MDAAALATQIVAILSPVIPSIVKGASGAAGKDLWRKLKALTSGNPELETAVKDLEADPQDEDNLACLRKAIRKLAASDSAIKDELEGLMAQSKMLVGGVAFIGNTIKNAEHSQIGNTTNIYEVQKKDDRG